MLRQLVLETIPYDLDDGTSFTPVLDWRACPASVGAVLAQFGIGDEESFADFDVYIGVANRLAKEVFHPLVIRLLTESCIARNGLCELFQMRTGMSS
jgi:hypothetical protein